MEELLFLGCDSDEYQTNAAWVDYPESSALSGDTYLHGRNPYSIANVIKPDSITILIGISKNGNAPVQYHLNSRDKHLFQGENLSLFIG